MNKGRAFRVVTDSTANLPAQWRDQFAIEVVPLKVLFGSDTYRDGVDLSEREFFRRLGEAKQLPTTSAPSPGEFAAIYERLAKECDGVISIHLGSSISGTAEAARVGAGTLEGFPVHVVDSGSVATTIAFLCRVAAESESLQAALKRVEERIPRLRIIALLDTLRYIEMGGRVSRAQAMVGTMLDLKPILGMSGGVIKSLDRVRTRARAIPRMLELLNADMPVERLAVMHAQAPDEAAAIRERLIAENPGLEVEVGEVGSVLGTHTGPRALGFGYITSGN